MSKPAQPIAVAPVTAPSGQSFGMALQVDPQDAPRLSEAIEVQRAGGVTEWDAHWETEPGADHIDLVIDYRDGGGHERYRFDRNDVVALRSYVAAPFIYLTLHPIPDRDLPREPMLLDAVPPGLVLEWL